MKRIIAAFVLLFSLQTYSFAGQIDTSIVLYKDGETILEGFMAVDNSVTGKKPVILVVHEWKGINEYTRKRCRQLAEMGYIAFAPDIYGKGIRPGTNADAAKEAGKYKSDRKLMRTRMLAGYNKATEIKDADPSRMVVIGYCFGGTAALELGRVGADVDGIVSIHGGLSNPAPADAKQIKGKVLVCHGAIDPNVPEKEVADFKKEMDEAGKDYQLIIYSGAVHAFTNPSSGNDPSKGAAYNETADRRSWQHLKLFLQETIGK